ncbi:hypothetical protein [Prescottella defluvii]|uniref:hypothetical protein n=1 Tax=Prescottella defluvii TaxID=1323361 RepID=UPI0012E03112|nr:hypothetical protein [Prescottella defluvii]
MFLENNSDIGSALLIQAPGAMGKSMAAQAIAAQAGCAYADLSTVKVGDNSLTGMIFKSLDVDQGASFMTRLKNGEGSLLLDSLDEAALAAGQSHFWAFLDDVAGLLVNSTPNRQLVILGRPESIQSAEMVLRDKGVSVEVAELSPLSSIQVAELTGNVLDANATENQRYTIHRTHPEPFNDLRDHVYQDMAIALDHKNSESFEWSSVESFLGYPPVVEAIAKRLEVENPRSELSRIRSTSYTARAQADRGRLLLDVTEVILDRESQKVRTQLQKILSVDDATASLLYIREEQIVRILSLLLPESLDVHAPAFLPPAMRAKYEERVAYFVPEHPFLYGNRFANQVFADYLRAYVSIADSIQAHGANREKLLSACARPGPFFVYFCHALAGQDAGNYAVTEAIVDDLVKSFTSGSRGNTQFNLVEDRNSRLRLWLRDELGDSAEGTTVEFTIDPGSGVIELSSPISRCWIVTTNFSFVLHGSTNSLELGPDCNILCDSLEIRASDINVFGRVDRSVGSDTLLMAHDFVGQKSQRVVVDSSASLVINWPDPWHPWQSHYHAIRSELSVPPHIARETLIGLRKILLSFNKSSTKAEPSQHRDLVDNIIVGSSETFKVILQSMLHIGAVILDGKMYRLQTSVLAPLGVNYAALRSGEWTSSLKGLMDKVLASETMQSYVESEK